MRAPPKTFVRARRLRLTAQGLKVLRFNALDILDAKRRGDVLETIAAVLVKRGVG